MPQDDEGVGNQNPGFAEMYLGELNTLWRLKPQSVASGREQFQADAAKCPSEVFQHMACLLLGFGESRDVVGVREQGDLVLGYTLSEGGPGSGFSTFPALA